jgi:hypothetical protein
MIIKIKLKGKVNNTLQIIKDLTEKSRGIAVNPFRKFEDIILLFLLIYASVF